MHPHSPHRVPVSHRARAGFTLIELMIAVSIIGILAAVAYPSMNSYIQKSRTSEATQFLGVIKLRQEAYRSEFGVYANYGNDDFSSQTWVPATTATVNAAQVAFPTNDASYNQLGAKPDSAWVRFSYNFLGGPPSALPPAGYGMVAANADHWFVAQATTDLDDDGTRIEFEVTSFTRDIAILCQGDTIGGTPCSERDKGWD